MATAILEPPTTEDELRKRAFELEKDVDQVLSSDAARSLEELEQKRRFTEREKWFEHLTALIRSLAKSEVWRDHGLARELLVTHGDLEEAIKSDPEVTDPEWKESEALKRMLVVVRAMIRQLEHRAIDRPEVAAQFVATQLEEVGDKRIADLLGTTPRMVPQYRQGVEGIRKDPDRITLVGQLVYELYSTMTPRGVALWFDAPREQFENKTPLDLIEDDVASASEKLLPLARGGRGQLDIGGDGPVG